MIARFPAILPAAALALAVGVAGCLDRPLPSNEPIDNTPPRIVAGPYADGSGPYGRDRVTLRFATNRPAVPGVRRRASEIKVVERTGVADTNQRLTVAFLQQDQTDPVEMLLDNHPGPALRLRGVADSGQPAKILFTERQAAWDRFGWRLAESLADAAVFLGPPLPPRGGAYEAAEVQDGFMGLLGAAAWTTPLHFVPGATREFPARLFPNRVTEGEGGVWSRDVGMVRLVGFDVGKLVEPSGRDDLLIGVQRACAAPAPGIRWRVGVSATPMIDRDGPHSRRVYLAAGELERAGLDWVISGGGRGYSRSAALAGDGGGRTRYASFGPADDPARNDPSRAGNAWLAAAGDAAWGILEADGQRLLWTAIAPDGTVVDRLEIHAGGFGGGGVAGEPVAARSALQAEAAARVAQQRELERVVRQLARRVPDPNAPFQLPLRVENATDLPLNLDLAWNDGVEGGGLHDHAVAPATASLRLEPWKGGLIPFTVTRGGGTRPARLTVLAEGAGTAEGELLLRPEVWQAVPYSPQSALVNGRLNEDAWNSLRTAPIEDFVRMTDGARPARRVQAAIAHDEKGLLVAFHVEADNPLGMPARAERPQEDHDSPNVARDESVEIWVDPERAGRDWYRFVVNVHKSRMEASSRGGVAWSPDWEMNSRNVDRNKAVDYEIRLPWTIFGLSGPPPAGTEWALNLIRNDIEPVRERVAMGDPEAEPEVFTWARVEGDPSRSGLFNLIRFTRRQP